MKNGGTLSLEEIHVGAIYSFEHTFSRHDEMLFAELTDDKSSVTLENETKSLVHGMLASSFFSTLIDTYCPGPNCLYMSQTLLFRKSLYYGDAVIVRGTVINKSPGTSMLTLCTEIVLGNEVVIS